LASWRRFPILEVGAGAPDHNPRISFRGLPALLIWLQEQEAVYRLQEDAV